MYLTKTINGVEICYDECGAAEGPPIVLLTGWAHDMRLYDGMLPYLAEKYWVIRLNWRGHSINRDYVEDFGVEEQVSDTLGLLKALDVDKFYLVSHSHGGWPALEIADRLGKERVLCLLMIDQIMTPPPPEFVSGLQAMQSKTTWRAARRGLFDHWLAQSNNQAVKDHFTYSMGSYGYPMWSLSCRVIEGAYKAHGSPMERMKKIRDPQPIRHIFSHPLGSPEYRKLHEDMRKDNPWFSYTDLKGETHFPDLEIPQRVCEEIEDLIQAVPK
ncbi:uncharacterized protein HMPREF1541_01806 [Cyphellophora europaea CBS 101466]|uniref:AB hydrolase-1 domain-containing protein n=1 Tax=Cyphellophora europaea (strain CBS 101466) TaxID=1220924 RepID=W2S3W2_CYPE1|nr:uncharacterized protein HMPREF1541_01806 [Cyphellophora europaea CBS 101466]ETN42649.1 hypothetical protein HMPREF1541_01806 [Cyphellophora europaea CBS 101466]